MLCHPSHISYKHKTSPQSRFRWHAFPKNHCSWGAPVPLRGTDWISFSAVSGSLALCRRDSFLWKPVYIITDPAAIADVLVNHPKSFIKPYLLRRLKVLFGHGLLTSDGDVWRHRRHLVQPAFSSDRMPGFVVDQRRVRQSCR